MYAGLLTRYVDNVHIIYYLEYPLLIENIIQILLTQNVNGFIVCSYSLEIGS